MSQAVTLSQLKLVAWDLDGTLYPANPELRQAFDQEKIKTVAQKFQLSFEQAQEKFRQKYKELSSNTKTLDFFGIPGQEFALKMWFSLNLEQYIQPNPELAQQLKQLKNKTKLQQFMLTNSNSLDSIKLKLNLIGLGLDLFDRVFNSIEIGYNKPDQRAFAVLWQETGFKPAEIVYIGDRANTDILPAKKLGLKTIQITTQEKVGQSPADLAFTNPVQAAQAILQAQI